MLMLMLIAKALRCHVKGSDAMQEAYLYLGMESNEHSNVAVLQ